MASNGLIQMAKKGKCQMCLRTRDTNKYLKIVGEVNHGYATGHIWECQDVEDCQKTVLRKLNDENVDETTKHIIKNAQKRGRATYYIIRS